jgi:hypothetical protein
LAETIKTARTTYSTAVADAKVARDTEISHAYAVFAEAMATTPAS